VEKLRGNSSHVRLRHGNAAQLGTSRPLVPLTVLRDPRINERLHASTVNGRHQVGGRRFQGLCPVGETARNDARLRRKFATARVRSNLLASGRTGSHRGSRCVEKNGCRDLGNRERRKWRGVSIPRPKDTRVRCVVPTSESESFSHCAFRIAGQRKPPTQHVFGPIPEKWHWWVPSVQTAVGSLAHPNSSGPCCLPGQNLPIPTALLGGAPAFLVGTELSLTLGPPHSQTREQMRRS